MYKHAEESQPPQLRPEPPQDKSELDHHSTFRLRLCFQAPLSCSFLCHVVSLPKASWLVCGQEARLQELTPSLGSNGFCSTAGRAQPQLRLTGRTGWAGLAPPINLTQVRSPARETPAGNWPFIVLAIF